MRPRPTFRAAPRKEKIRKRSLRTKLAGRFFWLRPWKSLMKSFLIGGGVVFTLLIILYVLVWAPRRATTHVERDADTLHTLSLPDVYEHVEESLMGQHYLRCRFTCGRRLTYQLQEIYPFIERIYVRPDGAQRFIVSIDFLPPRLMFGLGDYRRASFNEMIYMISPQESR